MRDITHSICPSIPVNNSVCAEFLRSSILTCYFLSCSRTHPPQNGPIIICSNHNNQFIDGLLIASHIARQVRFIVAAKSMRRPIIGHFARMFMGIPVERGQDVAVQGSGKIRQISKGVLTGADTKFLSEVSEKYILLLEGIEDEFVVEKVLSDTQLQIASSYKSPLSATAALRYKIQPKLDYQQMYESVWSALNNDECIGVFPEGGSHDNTYLLNLKAGICIMSLGAIQKYRKDVQIVACGLNYFGGGHKFRSRVIIEFGQPLQIPKELIEMYQVNKREAIKILLQIIQNVSSMAEEKRIPGPGRLGGEG